MSSADASTSATISARRDWVIGLDASDAPKSWRDRARPVASCRARREKPRAAAPTVDRKGSSVVIALARSEEHTSEIQSLMRISYAVFCLNKKKNNTYLQ